MEFGNIIWARLDFFFDSDCDKGRRTVITLEHGRERKKKEKKEKIPAFVRVLMVLEMEGGNIGMKEFLDAGISTVFAQE